MRQPGVWYIPRFLGGGVFVACTSDDPLAVFPDANGVWWKPRKRGALVQPDNPDDRGEPTVVWRTLPGELPAPAPAPALPEPGPEPAPLALPAPALFERYNQEEKELCLRLIASDAPEVASHHY